MSRPIVALAGASGFVGTELRRRLGENYRWIGLTRSEAVSEGQSGADTEWRACDLFSLPKVEAALQGADMAVYMVHSMLPSSRLVQASFQDLDLLLADNFIRAAEGAGVKKVVYLSGLIPENTPEADLSPHLASRLEVERVLRSRPLEVTVLRAGLIFGPGGSSAQMLLNLTRRLPCMILPAWTRNTTQSIDIADVIRAIDWSLQPDRSGVYDIAGHPPMTYREMILRTADTMGKSVRTLNAPFNFFRLSRLWVSLFSGVSPNLVNPLLESLRHPLAARNNPLLEKLWEDAVPFPESVRRAIDPAGQPLPNPRRSFLFRDRHLLQKARRVRSVQRMPLPEGWDAGDVAGAYANWLTRIFRIITVRASPEGQLVFRLGRRWILLELTPTPFSRESPRRRAYYISGGFLALKVEPPGRFEFRVFPENGCLIAAIHGYAPRLPWPLYTYTQAKVHLVVMAAFRRYLRSRNG